MRQFIPLAFIASAIALGACWWQNKDSVAGSQEAAAFLGDRWDSIVQADSVSVTRLKAAAMTDLHPITGNTMMPVVRDGSPVTVPTEWTDALKAEMSRKETYQGIMPACTADPGVLIEFRKGLSTTQVLLCFECLMIGVGDSPQYKWAAFQKNARAFAKLVKEAFPQDSAIQSIPEHDARE